MPDWLDSPARETEPVLEELDRSGEKRGEPFAYAAFRGDVSRLSDWLNSEGTSI
jgi:hypothetical protein